MGCPFWWVSQNPDAVLWVPRGNQEAVRGILDSGGQRHGLLQCQALNPALRPRGVPAGSCHLLLGALGNVAGGGGGV